MNKIQQKINHLQSELEKKELEIVEIKNMAIADVDTKETISQKLTSK